MGNKAWKKSDEDWAPSGAKDRKTEPDNYDPGVPKGQKK